MHDAISAYIVAGLRTPIADGSKALKDIPAEELAGGLIRTLMERTGVDPADIEDAVIGNCHAHETANFARLASLTGGLPETVPGITLDRQCTSGLEAIAYAANAVRAGEGHLYVCGGAESMTRRPWVMPKPETGYQMKPPQFMWPSFKLVPPSMGNTPMGLTAENLVDAYGISRDEQDAFALASHRKAASAWERGCFNDQVVAVTVPRKKDDPEIFARDQHVRHDTSMEALARLKPVFREGGSVTAGNSSPISDGAAMVLMASEKAVREQSLPVLGRVVAHAVVGVPPHIMGIGPAYAIPKVLRRAGLTLADIDLFELNEAFAAQMLAVERQLRRDGYELDPERVNVNGGAIALGHPIASSGARITVTLLHELGRRKARYGLASLCGGGGCTSAIIVERC